jgi:hypothetical protein
LFKREGVDGILTYFARCAAPCRCDRHAAAALRPSSLTRGRSLSLDGNLKLGFR